MRGIYASVAVALLAVPITAAVFISTHLPVEVTDLMLGLTERGLLVGPLLLCSIVARRQAVRKAVQTHYRTCLGK